MTNYSNEKRFRNDSPDGFKVYWRDLRDDNIISMSRRMGGDGTLLWGGISRYRRTKLAVVVGKQKSFD